MRRVLGTVLALLAATVAAPPATAAPAAGEVVFVGNGPSAGDVTLPDKVTLDFDKARYQAKGDYLALTGGPGKNVTMFSIRTPDSDWPFALPGYLPKGRSTVRMLADGPATVRVPAKGLRGTRTIRLTRRLPGVVVKTDAAELGVNAGRSEIPFTLSGTSVVIHGYTTPEADGVARQDWMCLGPAGTQCVQDDPRNLGGTSVGGVWNETTSAYFQYEHTGPLTSKLLFADAGLTGSVTHYVMAYSLR